MKKTKNISLFLILIAASCSTYNKIGEDRLKTERTPVSSFTIGNLLKIDSVNIEIIPPASGVQFYRDGIIHLESSKKVESILSDYASFGRLKTYYSGLYECSIYKCTDFSPTVSFDFPSDGITFSNDFKTMYFTQIAKKDRKEKIYHAIYSADNKYQTGWQLDNSPLGFCTDNYIFTHPALSSDGSFMIFASDKRGSTGGLDLFISRKTEKGWSDSENLGYSINSKANELYPFLDRQNNLYFSSDRTGGYGGYDIYICKFNGKKWVNPALLPSRINSNLDEVAFTINKNSTSALYNSRKRDKDMHSQMFFIELNNAIESNRSKDISALIFDLVKQEEKQSVTEADTKVADVSADKTAETIEKNKSTAVSAEKSETNKNVRETAEKKEVVVYRVQIALPASAKKSTYISVNGTKYNIWSYDYKGTMRTTIGQYNRLSDAVKMKDECKKSGYQDAFVVVFVNDVRSNDPLLLNAK